METLQSTIFIEFDVNTKKITFLKKDNIIDYDSNATNIYVRVKYKNLSGNTVYLTPSELEDYKFSLYTMKPATNNVNVITGEVTDELKQNVYGGVVKFEIPRACTNRLGIVKCEIHINQENKIIASSTFVLDVKQSLVTAFDDELLGDEDFPVLKQLIFEIQKASNIDDDHRSKITTYSSDKIENIKEDFSLQINDKIKNISSQIKDKANKNEIFSMANMGQDVKEAMAGGSVAVVGQNTILHENIVNYQVTSRKLSDMIIESNNLIDPAENTYGVFVSENDGKIYNNASFFTTGYIEVVGGETYFNNHKTNIAWYDETYTFIEGTVQNTYQNFAVAPANAKYCRTCSDAENSFIFAKSSVVIPKDDYKYMLKNLILHDSNIKNYSIGKNKLNFELQEIELVYGKNMLDLDKIVEGYYLNHTTGKLMEQSSSYPYFTSDYITIEANTIYSTNTHNWGIIICYYDLDGTFLKGEKSSSLTITNTSKCKIRVSFPTSIKASAMVVKGSELGVYEKYSCKINEKYLPEKIKQVGNKISSNKLDSLTDGNTIILDDIPNIKSNKIIAFSGNVTTFDEIELSHGQGKMYSTGKFVISNTNIKYYNFTTQENLVETIEHNLTIKDIINVTVNVKPNPSPKANLTINTTTGTFTHEFVFDGCAQNIQVKSNNSTLTDCVLTFYSKDYDKDIWAFGDSYFDMWTWEAVALGASNMMIDGHSGRTSVLALDSLNKALEFGLPKKILWCMGMNDPDSDSSMNADWKDTFDYLYSFCKSNEIELIGVTIPNTPTRNHSFKNDYIKNLDIKYVDVSKHVGADDNTSWFDGLLSTDNVHPTTLGKKVIANVFLTNVPSII